MAGLLSGLANLGLGNLADAKVFEEPKEEKKEAAAPILPEQLEKDMVYDRVYECPMCSNKVASKVMKSGKAKLLKSDQDLRPIYEGIDPIKYDVVVCPKCGYSALTRYHSAGLTPTQRKLITENISKNVKMAPRTEDIYTYEIALERYQMALACAIVKQGKASEKAYICLKTAWVLRGWQESLDESKPETAEQKAELEAAEKEYLTNALEGFMTARTKENMPICGMDEYTVDYLIAVLAAKFERYDVASRMIAGLLGSSANPRMKDKARDLKDSIMAAMKKKSQ